MKCGAVICNSALKKAVLVTASKYSSKYGHKIYLGS
jgi:hypothetical protein